MTQLSSFWKSLAWDQWLYGLLSSVVGAGSTAASGVFAVMLIDPEKFNLAQSWNLVRVAFAIFAIAGLGQFFAYLKQGLPPVIAAQSATTQTETKPDGGKVTTETTSKVTIQQPIEQKETVPIVPK